MALTPINTLILRIARVAHAANRAYCLTLGDNSQPSWDRMSDMQRTSILEGVRFRLAYPEATVEETHVRWMAQKIRDGWVYGPVKDEAKKHHPDMVAWRDLPPEERLKDYIFRAIVSAWLDEANEEAQNEKE